MKKFFALLAMMLVAIGIQAQDSDFYYWKFNFKPGNTITFSDGSTITANGNPEAKYSRGGTVSYSGFSFPSILLPDGDQNTFTAPEGMLVSRIAFYSYSMPTRPTWKAIAIGKKWVAWNTLTLRHRVVLW